MNTFLVNSGFTDSDISLIRTFRDYGANLIELAVVDPSSVTPEKLLPVLDESGLGQPVVCGAFGEGRDLRGTPEEVNTAVGYLSALIDLAEALGSKVVCGPVYSRTGRCGAHSAEEREAQLDRIAAALQPICTKADSVGVMLAVEPLNRFETDCINTVDQAVDLIQRVDSPALKIHIDTFHMHIEEADSAEAIQRVAGYIGHVHASASHRGLLGEDQVDWDGVCAALKQVGYAGDIVIESFSPENQVIARAASIWREMYDSPEQLAVSGLQFLRDQWEAASSKRV
ncbi:MAG: sugar phosphate isomerase/epimerase family protein [Coraliomargaritaceae bacterium]